MTEEPRLIDIQTGIEINDINGLAGNFKKEKPIKIEPKAEAVTSRNKVGRNEPCPCGKKKKFKKCCLKIVEEMNM